MVSSSRVWVWSGGSSPGRTRHSTTAQSPPDCSPTISGSRLEPWPLVTVRPPPGPVRTGSVRDMCLPFHAVVGQAGRRARSTQMLLVAVSAGDARGRGHLAIASDPRGHRQVRRARVSPRLSERECRARRFAAATHFGAEAAVFVAVRWGSDKRLYPTAAELRFPVRGRFVEDQDR